MTSAASPVTAKADQVFWQLVDKLEEQRRHPRLPLEIPVAFRNSRGQHCAARLTNLSADGLQVRCNAVTAQIIHTEGGRIAGPRRSILQATLALPLGAGAETLSIGARLLYLSTVFAEPRCMLGFQFLEPRPKAKRIIDGFFTERVGDIHGRLAAPTMLT